MNWSLAYRLWEASAKMNALKVKHWEGNMSKGHKWNFKNCSDPEIYEILKTFDNSQAKGETKVAMGCECEDDTLNYTVDPLDPCNSQFEIKVLCLVCDKSGIMKYPPKEALQPTEIK